MERGKRKGRQEKSHKRHVGVKVVKLKRSGELGCMLPGYNFHILPIATPKSLIVWPQRKYCSDHSTAAIAAI